MRAADEKSIFSFEPIIATARQEMAKKGEMDLLLILLQIVEPAHCLVWLEVGLLQFWKVGLLSGAADDTDLSCTSSDEKSFEPIVKPMQ